MEHYLADIAREWLGNMRSDMTRYVVFAISVWLVLWVLMAPLLRGRKIRPESPPARQLITEFLVSIRSIAIFSTIGLTTFLLERAGLLPGVQLGASWGPVWFWTCLALIIVGHDAYFYWAHRLMHHPRVFRFFHRRHHKSMNPSPFTAYSFDLGEAAVMASFVPLWVFLVPTPWGVTGLFMLHQIFRNTLGHSGYELMPARGDGRPMFDFLTTTTHHDLHHAQAGWNYGLYFTWWDRLMGTEHPEYHARFAATVRKPSPSVPTPNCRWLWGRVVSAIRSRKDISKPRYQCGFVSQSPLGDLPNPQAATARRHTGVTAVTSAVEAPAYVQPIESSPAKREFAMTKFFNLCLAAALFAPVAFATLNQAALIVA